MALSTTRASQIICTGTTILIIGGVMIALCVVLSLGKHNLGSVLSHGAAFWAGIPVTVAGIIGILAGASKKSLLVNLFLLFSVFSFVLGIIMSVFIGLLLRKWRSHGECSYIFCAFDEVSILLIVLLTNCALLCILSVTGIIEASLPSKNADQESELNESNEAESSSNVPRAHLYKKQGKNGAFTNRDRSYHKAVEKHQITDTPMSFTAV